MQIYPIVFISLVLSLIGLLIISKLLKLSTNILFIGIFATIVGLLIGSLATTPLSKLPGDFGVWIPILVAVLSVFGTLVLFLSKKDLILRTFEGISKIFKLISTLNPIQQSKDENCEGILVDTSVIIDGRIFDIVSTGFISEELFVPRFILEELQNVADSENSIKRSRGRKGLEVLNNLKKKYKIKILEEDVEKVKEADAKLVKLAKKKGYKLLTTDYNLNKVAKIEGVKVLNINELANSLKPYVLPGEELLIKVVQAGKEKNQGVGYLPDGTMVVVEGGDKMVGKEVLTEVKRIFQTDAGKMFFAVPKTVNKK